jgi:hypothetical protein
MENQKWLQRLFIKHNKTSFTKLSSKKILLFASIFLIPFSFLSAQPYQAATWTGYDSYWQQFPLDGTIHSSYVTAATHNYSGLITTEDGRTVWENPNIAGTLNTADAPFLSYTISTTTAITFDRFVMHGLAITGTSKLQLRWSVDNYSSSLGEFISYGSDYTLTSVQLGNKGPIPAGSVEFRIYCYASTGWYDQIYNPGNYGYPAADGTPAFYGYNGPNISIWYSSPGPGCSGTPTAGTASVSPASGIINAGDNATLTLSGYTNTTGISIQWQQSATSAGTYTDIGGATSASYNTGTISAASTKYYRAKVTCTSSGEVSYSNAVSVAANAISTGKALVFDGNDDYVSIGTPLSSNSSYTKEAWIYVTKDPMQPTNILSSYRSPFWIYGGQLRAGNNVPSEEVIDPKNFPTNSWVHVAVSFDATTNALRLYRNGVLVNSTISEYSYVSENNYIGAWFNGTSTESFMGGNMDEVRIWNVSRTAGEIKNGMYGTVAGNTPGLIAYYKMNEGSGTAVNNSTAAGAADGTLYNGAAWTASPIQAGSNAIALDGIDDFISVPANSNYDFTTGTVECWVRPENLVENACIMGNRNETTTRYSFHMSTTTLGLYNGSAYSAINFASTPGQWYHLAFVLTPGATDVYVNGSQIGTISLGAGAATGLPVQIGAADASLFEPFSGTIDEVRIWNIARSQAQIQGSMYTELGSAEPNLVGLFSFNQAVASGDNSGLVTVIDGTSGNNHGSLSNLALAGTSSNWISHSFTTTTLPIQLTSFTAVKKQSGVLLEWTTASENNSAKFEVERSADGRAFTRIATVTAAGESAQKLNYTAEDMNPVNSVNYYRLKLIDKDGSYRYSPVVSVSWNKKSAVSVTLAPQPMRDVMNVRVNGIAEKTSFVIYDLSGNKLKTYAVAANTGLQVDKGQMVPGIYVYKLLSANGAVLATGKIAVQ